MARADALAKSKEAGLDLVEIAPTANPPVCRIMNFGKFIYQQKKKQQDSKKKQKTTQVKEVKFRPNIDDHDYDFKMKNILKFLAHGDKVKATVQFRGREMARRENGQKVLDRLLTDLAGKAVAESRSEMLMSRRMPRSSLSVSSTVPLTCPGALGLTTFSLSPLATGFSTVSSSVVSAGTSRSCPGSNE